MGRVMTRSGFPNQVNDWLNDAADAPRGRRLVSRCIAAWSHDRFVTALVLAVVVFIHPLPDFQAPVHVKRAGYS